MDKASLICIFRQENFDNIFPVSENNSINKSCYDFLKVVNSRLTNRSKRLNFLQVFMKMFSVQEYIYNLYKLMNSRRSGITTIQYRWYFYYFYLQDSKYSSIFSAKNERLYHWDIWRPQSLSELNPIISNTRLTHLCSEASIQNANYLSSSN